jgi:hypothetical protein
LLYAGRVGPGVTSVAVPPLALFGVARLQQSSIRVERTRERFESRLAMERSNRLAVEAAYAVPVRADRERRIAELADMFHERAATGKYAG